jgi:hypothetical protein
MSASSNTVVTPAAYTALSAPSADPGFDPNFWVFDVTVGIADISFDGVNTALTLAVADAAFLLPVNYAKAWFRQNGGAATIRWSALTTR